MALARTVILGFSLFEIHDQDFLLSLRGMFRSEDSSSTRGGVGLSAQAQTAVPINCIPL
jgi:hypothetical protein